MVKINLNYNQLKITSLHNFFYRQNNAVCSIVPHKGKKMVRLIIENVIFKSY